MHAATLSHRLHCAMHVFTRLAIDFISLALPLPLPLPCGPSTLGGAQHLHHISSQTGGLRQVVGSAAAHLTSLQIADAWLHGWAAAAPLLTSLKHLSLDGVLSNDPSEPHIPGKHLSLLQQLTYLQLVMWPSVTAATMAELSSLSRLQELRRARGGDWLESNTRD
jgi:hypothetical protein